MKDVIIIGGSGAGVSAGIYAARSGLNVMLVTENFGGQLLLTEKIENYPGFPSIHGFELALKLREHLKSYKEIEVLEGIKVTSIEKKQETFIVKTSKDEFESKAVIIATGKRPRKLEVKGTEKLTNKGIHYCAICDGPLYKGKNSVVIGGGYSGTEEALFLSNMMKKVFILEYGDSLRGEKITLNQVKEKENIEVILNAELLEVLGNEKVEGIKFKDRNSGKEKELNAESIFVNIGEIPNSDFTDLPEKTKNGEIKINEKNESNIKGLFAAGDVTNILLHQLVISAAEGCKAALNVNEFLRKK